MALRIPRKTTKPEPADLASAPPAAGDADWGLPPQEPSAPPLPRKKPPVVLFGGIAVFLVVALAAGAWIKSNQAPPEDTAAPPVVMHKKPRPADGAAAPPGLVAPAGRKVTPGDAGIAPPGSAAPALKPNGPGKLPAMVPQKGSPTPVQAPSGQAAQPGVRESKTFVRVAPVSNLPAPVQRQLKKLWEKGAAAKHHKQYAAARAAWQELLGLSPGHPGVQEAIDKLPPG